MRKYLFSMLIIAFSVLPAFAGHVDTYGIGSKATSMGGAVVAGSDDVYSVYYNPAAMVNIKKTTLSIGAHIVNPSLRIKNYDVETSGPLAGNDMGAAGISDQSGRLVVPHFGYVKPLNDKVTLGIAFYVPYGLDLKWDSDPLTNPASYNTFHSWYAREVLTPSVAYKVNEHLSLGAGVSIGRSQAGVERRLYFSETLQALSPKYRELNGTGVKMEYDQNYNYSWDIGALYKFNDKLSAGIAYRSYSHILLDGTAKTDKSLTYSDNYDVDSSTSIDTPDSIQFGVQYKFTPKFSVEADVVRTFWSKIRSYSVTFDETFLDLKDSEHFQRNWRDTWQYRIGAQYQVNDMVDLRAGYYYDQTVVPNDTFDVVWPDSNKHIFSGGIGLHFGQVSVDGVLQYIRIEELTVASGESEELNTDYTVDGFYSGDVSAVADGHIWAGGVTISYQF